MKQFQCNILSTFHFLYNIFLSIYTIIYFSNMTSDPKLIDELDNFNRVDSTDVFKLAKISDQIGSSLCF